MRHAPALLRLARKQQTEDVINVCLLIEERLRLAIRLRHVDTVFQNHSGLIKLACLHEPHAVQDMHPCVLLRQFSLAALVNVEMLSGCHADSLLIFPLLGQQRQLIEIAVVTLLQKLGITLIYSQPRLNAGIGVFSSCSYSSSSRGSCGRYFSAFSMQRRAFSPSCALSNQ